MCNHVTTETVTGNVGLGKSMEWNQSNFIIQAVFLLAVNVGILLFLVDEKMSV